MKSMIRMFYPHIPETASEVIIEVLKGRIIGAGPKVDEFEQQFAKKFSFKHVVAVNGGTSAIRLALTLANVGPRDEVITTPYTAVATNTPILENYAVPVFADIQYETLNIDPLDIEHRISKKTKAIISVHFGGYPCDMDEIHEIASKYNIPVIEDSSHALGASYRGKPIGLDSDYTTFSFGATKHITTIDGGMLCVKNDAKYKEALRRRWYGIDRASRKPTELGIDPSMNITEVGFKYTLNDVAASLGLEQLKFFDKIFEKRAYIAKIYREELENVKGLKLLESRSDRVHGNWLFPLHVNKRLQFAKMMRSNNIEVMVHNERNDKYDIFGGIKKDLLNTKKAEETAICIPLHHKLSDEDICEIINIIKKGW